MSRGKNRNRKNNGRSHAATLQQKSTSAQAKGIANTPAPGSNGVVQSCPKLQRLNTPAMATHVAQAAQQTNYEFCNLKSLQVTLKRGDDDEEVTLSARRRDEPVLGTSAWYKDELASYDLVMEVLSLAPDSVRVGSTTKFAKDREPLHVTATASNGPKHTSFAPDHPAMVIDNDAASVTTAGGTPAASHVELDELRWLAPGTWGRLWPFRGGCERRVVLTASACGNVQGGKSLPDLTILMPVYPDEEWTISFGVGNLREWGTKDSREDFEKRAGTAEAKVLPKPVPAQSIGNSTVIATAEPEVSFPPPDEDDEEDSFFESHAITVEWKVAGQECEFEAAETIQKVQDDFHRIADLLTNIAGMFDVPSIGWSYDLEATLLQGDLKLGWGHRWPKNYAERERVYYVRKFISVGGSCTLLDGKIEGMFGIDIDVYGLPKVACKVSAEFAVTIEIGATVEKEWSNAKPLVAQPAPGRKGRKKKGAKPQRTWLVPFDASASIEPTIAAEAGVSWLGYSISVSAGVEGTQELSLAAGLTADGFEATTSFESEPVEAFIRFEWPFWDAPQEYRRTIMEKFTGWEDVSLI